MASKIELIKKMFFGMSEDLRKEVIRFVILNSPCKLRDLFSKEEIGRIGAFDITLPDGQVGEIAFLNIATSGKHEVKRDFEVSKTGRIAVELEYKGNLSCLSVTEAPYWVYWLSGKEYSDEVAVIITVPRLKKLTRLGHYVMGGDNKASLLSIFDVKWLLLPDSKIEEKLAKRCQNDEAIQIVIGEEEFSL